MVELRIGGVPYGVGDPLLVGLEREQGVTFVRRPPRLLVEDLRAGRLDAGLVSSIEAFRRPGYRIAPRLGICCDGPVRSVRLFVRPEAGSERPIRSVGLDDGSESSVALTKILLQQGRFGSVAPTIEYTRVTPTRTPDDLGEDMILLIGDVGLTAASSTRRVHDLGAVWKADTGLPFVFAVWLIRPGLEATDERRLIDVLDAAAARGAAVDTGSRPDGTHHRMGAAEREGLEAFRRAAVEHGQAEAHVQPAFLDT